MQTALVVDRSALADTAQADLLAGLLVSQIASQLDRLLPIPVEALAKSCGIVDIQPLQTENFVGVLMPTEN